MSGRSADRHLSLRAARLLLLAAVVLSAWRFYRIRNYFDFCDEAAETTTAWLVSEGETLYGSVFSHHMPLAVIVSHFVATVSPTDHPAHFRATPWAAYVLVALAITFGPCGRRRPAAGALAGAAFLTATSLLAPLLWAQLALNDVFWGAAFAAFFVLLPLPLLIGEEPRKLDAALAGAAACISLSGSPLGTLPIVLGLVISALLTARKSLLPNLSAFALGGGAAAACIVAWLLRFADLAGFNEEFFRFNRLAYARFLGNANSPLGMAKVSAIEWRDYVASALHDAALGNIQALLLPLILVVLALLVLVNFRARSSTSGAVFLALFVSALILSLRLVRGGDFRAIPMHLTIFAAGAVFSTSGLFGKRWIAPAALLLAMSPAVKAAVRHESFRFNEDSRFAADGAWLHAARYIEAHTQPTERVASFPVMPSIYLESRRRPATDSVYFLPWQAVWESEIAKGRPSTCAQLRANPPAFVALQDTVVWGHYPWKDYASCIDSLLKSDYEVVGRPELGGLLLKRRKMAR